MTNKFGLIRQRFQLRFAAALMFGIMLLAAVPGGPAMAATRAGVTLPNTTTAAGKTLVLNGIGLRTYSFFSIHIYVAGLYLQKQQHDAKAILNSSGTKVLILHFVHNVSASKIRKTWRKGLRRNCTGSCTIKQSRLKRFLSHLQAVKSGDTVKFVFTPGHAKGYFNGKLQGTVDNQHFAHLMLAVFLGPNVKAPHLKKELLGKTAGSRPNH